MPLYVRYTASQTWRSHTVYGHNGNRNLVNVPLLCILYDFLSMPYTSIAKAEKAGFPISSDKTPLTLPQVNKLAELYDAIKAAGTAEVPMAVAWKEWKAIYEKQGDKWVLKKKVESKAVSGGLEIDSKSLDEWVPVAKVGQEALLSPDNIVVTYGKNGLMSFANGSNPIDITYNHGPDKKLENMQIENLKFEDPYLYMQISEQIKAAMKNPNISGCSIEGKPRKIKDGVIEEIEGTVLSLMEYPLLPACKLEDGCGIAASSLQEQMEITSSAGINIETTVSSQAVATVSDESTKAFDTYVVNNAGVTVKIGTDTVYGSKKELSDKEYIKRELLQRGGYYGRDNLQFYEKDDAMKLGDVIPVGLSPVHVMSLAISKETQESVKSDNPHISEKMGDGKIEIIKQSSRGGDVEGMDKEEPVTYSGDQVNEMIASKVGEVETNLKNQQEVNITALKDKETKAKEELETKHTVELKAAAAVAYKKAGVVATFKAKFNPSEDVLKKAEELDPEAIEFFNGLNIPMQESPSGVTSAAPDTEEKSEETVKDIKTRFYKKLGRGAMEE